MRAEGPRVESPVERTRRRAELPTRRLGGDDRGASRTRPENQERDECERGHPLGEVKYRQLYSKTEGGSGGNHRGRNWTSDLRSTCVRIIVG